VRPDGEVRWVLEMGATEYTEDGTPLRMSGTILDVTDRRRYEAETERARAAAEASLAAKSRFLAMMSHEIRTPITGVLGLAEILQATKLDREQAGYLDALKSSTAALLVILNDILDASKIDAGKLTIERIEFGLRDAVRDSGELMRSSASARGVAVSVEIPDDVPEYAVGDPTRFRQILFNLLGNAIKFTERGSVRIALSVPERRHDGFVLLTEVVDTGIGIEEHLIPRMFEVFSQADDSTTRRYGGTGLGLAVVKSIVELMGGELKVSSTPGFGSTFSFTLPLGNGMARQQRTAAAPALVQTVSRSRRILVAEDNSINRMLLKSMLGKMGHQVECVENGRLAVDRMMSEDFDVVIMDMQMPVMDGEDATVAIRALPEPKCAVPVLALTADVMPEHSVRYMRAGVNAILAKPIDWGKLSAAIEDATRAAELHCRF
jgi:signal transduction histidine kinase/CheY-like chemotaxis protein